MRPLAAMAKRTHRPHMAGYGQWRRQKFQLGGASSPFPSPPLPPFVSPLPFLPVYPSLLFPCPALFPSLPLEVVRPIKFSHMGSGALQGPPAGSRVEPQPKLNLVHFCFRRWDLVATIFVIFSRLNWPNWQIHCSFNVCLCIVFRIVRGLASPSPCLRRSLWDSCLLILL